jgi:hypothetical protein
LYTSRVGNGAILEVYLSIYSEVHTWTYVKCISSKFHHFRMTI